MTEPTALTTVTENGVVARSTTSLRAVTPAPTVAPTIAAMFQRGAGVTDPIPNGPLAGYSRSLVETLKDTVAKGAPDAQLYMFIHQAIEYNLDPTKKEVWCVNMAGKDQPPQWMVAPSRDGYLRMAQRHPNFDQIRSGVVREGDRYEIDVVNGTVIHSVNGMQARGAILGAWCLVTTKDRKRYVHQVLLSEVRRSTKVWDNFTPQMVEKAVQSQTLRKAGLFSNVYVTDRVWEAIDADSVDAVVIDPTQAEYVDGFVVGVEPPQLAAPAEPAAPDRASRNDGVKVLNDRIAEICATVKGANKGDALDARTVWLKAADLPPISKIENPDIVWGMVDKLDTEAGAAEFAVLVTDARDVRWTKEANAKEAAAASQPVQVAEPVVDVSDDEIPDSFEDAPLLNGGADA